MKEVYNNSPFPKKESLEDLAKEISESIERIETWFRAERKRNFDLGKIKYEVFLLKNITKNILLQRKHHFSDIQAAFLKEEFKKCRFPSNEFCEQL